MKSVNENENMQQNWFLMNLLNYIVAASFIFIEFISNYSWLRISKNNQLLIFTWITEMKVAFRHEVFMSFGVKKIRKCQNTPISFREKIL